MLGSKEHPSPEFPTVEADKVEQSKRIEIKFNCKYDVFLLVILNVQYKESVNADKMYCMYS